MAIYPALGNPVNQTQNRSSDDGRFIRSFHGMEGILSVDFPEPHGGGFGVSKSRRRSR
jgi:hypothetical protein